MTNRIVVGVDDSQGGRAAMRWALREAGLRNAAVEAVHTWSMPWSEGFNTAWAIDRAAFEEGARAMMRGVVAEAQRDVGVSISPTLAVVEGVSAASALTEAADGADLLVVGSRGRSGLTGLALGSVSTACVHRATCPVVVVRPERHDVIDAAWATAPAGLAVT
ncbi:universal stress protein [soil metagenome]